MLWTPASANILSFISGQEQQSSLDPNNEKQVSTYNEQAIQLFEQGRFEEAQDFWEKALEILERPGAFGQEYPELTGSVESEDVLLLESGGELDNDRVSQLYDTAVSMFKKEKYVASKKIFERIEATIPDYKATRNYLIILDHKIRRAQQNLSEKSFEKNAIARREERAEWGRILEESRMELENKLAEQAEPLYQEAVEYYKSREFQLAKDYFMEVNNILPQYKDTDKYLSRIDRDIKEEEKLLMESKRKRELLARKKEKEEWKRILQESEQELQKKLIQQVDAVYQEAQYYYKKREFELAKERFEEAQLIVPNYKSTLQYLGRIDRDLQEEIRLRQEQRARGLEREKREQELARRRQEERLEELREAKENQRLAQFEMEVAQRRKERQEWLKTLEESEKERQKRLEEQAQYIYQEAIKYYKQRHFEQAKEDFLEVQRIYPNYKSTGNYLARIDRDIEGEQKQRMEERQRLFQLKLREKKLFEQKKWEEDQKIRAAEEQDRMREFQEKALAREKQRKEWERILQENEKERQKKLEEEAEFIYQEALKSYQVKRFEEAKAAFLEVEQVVPGYKLTKKYLAGIDNDIWNIEQERRRVAREESVQRKQGEMLKIEQEEKRQMALFKAREKKDLERKEAQAEAVYQFAESLYKRGDYEQAKNKFLEVEQILAGYKSTPKYLNRIDQDIQNAEEQRLKDQRLAFEQQIRQQRLSQKLEEERVERLRAAEEEQKILKLREEALLREQERKAWERTIKDIEKEHRKRLQQQADSVYEEAMRYYKAGWLEQAKETLEEVEVMWPGYKSTAKYLAKIDSEIRKNRRLRQENEEEIVKRQQWQEELAREKRDTLQQSRQKAEEQERLTKLKVETLARKEEKERLKESMDRIEREYEKQANRKAESLYREALKYYKDKDFEKAKVAFIDVERTSPGYKSASKYLSRIDEDIRSERLTMERDNVQSRGRYMETPETYALERNGSKVVQKASQERQEQFLEEAEAKYREALALYKAKEFIRAKLKFIEVESLYPGYKKTLNYLGRIDEDISENQKMWIEDQPRGMSEGQELDVLTSKLEIVEQALLQAEGRSQGFVPQKTKRLLVKRQEDGQTADWEKQIQERREELRAERRRFQQEYERQFQQLYSRAVTLYRNQSYEEAKALFLQIEQMKPGYKKAASYLKKAEAYMRKGLQKKSHNNVVYQPQEIKPRKAIVEDALDIFE
ncbi:MAG: hypothetical protein JW847_07890 [Candidatus Omnitrophica bacterium]|nr:hypothetical protein [Candidatus Omnitrophota bacterium]